MIKINCKWNDRGMWCKNRKIKRNLFGFGPRCCIEYNNNNKKCQLKEPWPKSPGPLPPPSPRPPKKNNYAQLNSAVKSMLEIIVEENKKLEKCKEGNKKLKKELKKLERKLSCYL